MAGVAKGYKQTDTHRLRIKRSLRRRAIQRLDDYYVRSTQGAGGRPRGSRGGPHAGRGVGESRQGRVVGGMSVGDYMTPAGRWTRLAFQKKPLGREKRTRGQLFPRSRFTYTPGTSRQSSGSA